ncbi:MAG: hypothetical protein WA055_02100 [Candidatus Moraniibacteriota bacterium]
MSDQNQSLEQTQNVPTKKAWYKKWWVITIGVIILIGVIGSFGEDTNKKPATQEQGTEKTTAETKLAEPEKIVPQITVTSATLSKEYSENEVAADAKYKGKIIEISGKVTSVDNGITDNEMIVKLSDGNYDFSGPMCYMKVSEREKVLAFKKGNQVTLIGKGDSATIGSPILKDCFVK